jgi:hypothetical protein
MASPVEPLRDRDAEDERDADDDERARAGAAHAGDRRAARFPAVEAVAADARFLPLLRGAHPVRLSLLGRSETSPYAVPVGEVRATGGCLCGAVRFEVRGPLRDVLVCHCVECRRWSGHVWAATSAKQDDVVFVEQRGLRWVVSPESESHARRGFCGECGSSLFWDPPARDTVSISAGALDEPTGLKVVGHVYVSQARDYEPLPEDGLPRAERLRG